MSQDELSIQHKLVKQMYYEKVIDTFAAEKTRKINF